MSDCRTGLSELSELSDQRQTVAERVTAGFTVGMTVGTVGTVGLLSDYCRTTVGLLSESTVGLSDQGAQGQGAVARGEICPSNALLQEHVGTLRRQKCPLRAYRRLQHPEHGTGADDWRRGAAAGMSAGVRVEFCGNGSLRRAHGRHDVGNALHVALAYLFILGRSAV